MDRTALASKVDFFHTAYLFAPAGTDLTLHTHTALPAFAGATVLGSMPLIMALNITTLASLALNGICTYALAWSVTYDRAGALVAGIIFGCSPFIAAHLMGHFNLTTAWTIPLFALASINGVRSGSPPWAIVAGVTLAAKAYIDYYYVVYAAAFAVCVFLCETRTWTFARHPAARGAATYTLSGLWDALGKPLQGVPRSTPEPVTFQLAPDLNGEYSLSSSDLRHRAVFSGIWEVHGGFQVSGTHYMGVGQRAQTIYGGDLRNLGGSDTSIQRLRPNGTIVAAQRLHSARA